MTHDLRIIRIHAVLQPAVLIEIAQKSLKIKHVIDNVMKVLHAKTDFKAEVTKLCRQGVESAGCLL